MKRTLGPKEAGLDPYAAVQGTEDTSGTGNPKP